MEKKVVYTTVDGKCFVNEIEAFTHEKTIENQKAMEKEAGVIFACGNGIKDGASRLISLMLGDPHPWLAILNSQVNGETPQSAERMPRIKEDEKNLILAKTLVFVKENPGCSRGMVAKAISVHPDRISLVVKALVDKGLVEIQGSRGTAVYFPK